MLQETYDYLIEQLLAECRKFYGSRLVSFCLFGSAARGTVGPHSDIDFLLVVDPLPRGRVRRVEEFMAVERALQDKLDDAWHRGICVELSPVLKTPEEVRIGSPLFLDMVEDGRILYDSDGFFQNFLAELKARLRAQGAHRVFQGDSWYWVLKDPYVPGEEIEL
jgi:predicted nucleotidyltransferase